MLSQAAVVFQNSTFMNVLLKYEHIFNCEHIFIR